MVVVVLGGIQLLRKLNYSIRKQRSILIDKLLIDTILVLVARTGLITLYVRKYSHKWESNQRHILVILILDFLTKLQQIPPVEIKLIELPQISI